MDLKEIMGLIRDLSEAIYQVYESDEELDENEFNLLSQTVDKLLDRYDQLSSQQQETVQKDSPFSPVQLPNTPSNDAQLLWILAGQNPEAFVSYLRSFPTPETHSLLNKPVLLNSTISQLNQMMPSGEPPVINGIQHADLNSSNIWGAAYNPKNGKMRVRFQGGSEYEYDGIPKAIFDAFIHGDAYAKTSGQNKYGRWWKNKKPSLGAAMNQYIKAGNFPYRKIK